MLLEVPPEIYCCQIEPITQCGGALPFRRDIRVKPWELAGVGRGAGANWLMAFLGDPNVLDKFQSH